MGKEATLQVRMDAELKEQVELLYKKLGSSSNFCKTECRRKCNAICDACTKDKD